MNQVIIYRLLVVNGQSGIYNLDTLSKTVYLKFSLKIKVSFNLFLLLVATELMFELNLYDAKKRCRAYLV